MVRRPVWAVLTMLAVVCGLVGCDGDEDGTTGTISVAVSNLAAEPGNELAGVLFSDTADGGTAVAGFAVIVDSEPFSHTETLGNVSEEWPDDGSEGWPWPTGVATVPAGTYSLLVALGNDFCCYSRWMPAATDGLHACMVTVAITGDDQTIEITDIPEEGSDGAGVCGVR